MKKTIKISYNAPVVLSFIFLCFGVLLLAKLTGGSSTRTFFMTYRSSLKNPLTYLRFFTHVLGHSGWGHLIGNATYLLLLGPMLEEKYGSETMLEIIGITAFVTGLVNFILFPHTALCGASGVVFAFIILVSFTGFKDGEIPLTFLLIAVIYIGQQIYEGVAFSDNISNTTHIVGGFVGAAIGYILNKRAN